MSTTNDDLVERIARLIYDADALRPRLTWERLTPLTQGEYRKEARSALTAFPLAEANTARLAELERENARLRELLSETMMDIAIFEDIGHIRVRAMERRAALAGSGEK